MTRTAVTKRQFPISKRGANIVKCEYCGQRNEESVNICPYCGAPLPVPNCSKEEEATPTYNESSETTNNNDSSLFEKTLASIGALAAASTLRKQPIGHMPKPVFDRHHQEMSFRDRPRHDMRGESHPSHGMGMRP